LSTCKICESHGVNHEDVVAECLNSPIAVGKLFFNFDKLESGLHRAIEEWFLRHLRGGERRFLIMIPRDHLKTSYFSICVPSWLLLRDPNERILNVMAARRESQKTLSVIQKAFMSERLRHFFPERALDPHHPDMKATAESMIIKRPVNWREGSLEAFGLDSNVTGGHFTVHNIDDLIDRSMAKSTVEQEKAIEFIQELTNMQVEMDADLRIIEGTMWEGDYYEWLLFKSGLDKYYKKLVLGCYADSRFRDFLAEIGKTTTLTDDDPIWPEQFTRSSLKRIAIEQGPAKFSRQFLNIPVQDAYQRFRQEDFVVYTLSPDRRYAVIGDGEDQIKSRIDRMQKHMVIDPATGEGKKTDETAISVVGVDERLGMAFVLEDWARRALPHETIEAIFHISDRWGVPIVCPEDVSYQKVFKHFLKDEMVRRGASFRIRPVKPGNLSKGTRIESLEPFARAGRIAVRPEHFSGVVKEALDVVIVRGKVEGRSPNRLDALAYQTQFWGNVRLKDAIVLDGTEDIDEWDPLEERSEEKAYGLSCDT